MVLGVRLVLALVLRIGSEFEGGCANDSLKWKQDTKNMIQIFISSPNPLPEFADYHHFPHPSLKKKTLATSQFGFWLWRQWWKQNGDGLDL